MSGVFQIQHSSGPQFSVFSFSSRMLIPHPRTPPPFPTFFNFILLLLAVFLSLLIGSIFYHGCFSVSVNRKHSFDTRKNYSVSDLHCFGRSYVQAVVCDVFVHRGGAVFLWELKETVSSVTSVERIEFSSS